MTRLTGLPVKWAMLYEYMLWLNMACAIKIPCLFFFNLLQNPSICEPPEFAIVARPVWNPALLWSLSHPPIRIRRISSKSVHHVSRDARGNLSAAYCFCIRVWMITSPRVRYKTLMFGTCLGHFLISYFGSNIKLLHLFFFEEVCVQGIQHHL